MPKENYFSHILLLTAPLLLTGMVVISLLYGVKHIDFAAIQGALLNFNPDNIDQQIIMSSRLPRAVGTVCIGAALAISGTLMQGITRNDLADPGIMGISDGSILAVTLSMILLPGAAGWERMLFSFAGSAFGAGIVFGIGSLVPRGLSPVRLAILGTIIGTFLSSLGLALAVYFQISQDISFWYHARLHQLQPDALQWALPFFIIGILVALWVARSVTVVSLGEEVAISLGQRIIVVKLAAAVAVMLLTGSAVALAGKIAFVGLIIPHITRFLTGADYKWIVPCSGVLGAVFLTFADVASRFFNHPFETPVDVISSLVGVPFFLYLARKRGGHRYV